MNITRTLPFLPLLVVAVSAQAQKYDGSDTLGIEQIVTSLAQQKRGISQETWRQEAQVRIEKYRKSLININITDKNGQPISGAQVQLKQLSHDFTFGGVVTTRDFQHQAEVLPNFINQLGFNNALKYKHKERLSGQVQPIIDWAHQHDISVRGHCLVYPGWIFLHQDAKHLQQTKNVSQLKAYLSAQINDYAPKWDVVEWDVMNETLDNFEIPDLIGRQVKADWFKQAKSMVKNPDARLLINENRVISAPPEYVDRIELYREEIKEVLADGGPIDAIGMQSRFRVDSITPQMVYQRLEKFSEFNLPIVATEFEIVNTPKYQFKPTALRRAQMTEEYMQVLFSHPNVDSIIAWTVLNGLKSRSSMHDKLSNEKETRGILNWDLSLPLNGKVWLYLIKQQWSTNESRSSDNKGNIQLKGFHGEYQLTIKYQGKELQQQLHLGKEPLVTSYTI